MKDRTLICIQCSRPFVFSVADQQRFDARGFGEPKRCPECRRHKERAAQTQPNSWERHKKKPHSHRSNLDFDEE